MTSRLFFTTPYLKTGLKVLIVYCLVYAFQFCQFIWGNHDWNSLKYGVNWLSGLFEARFSQHAFTILLFDGQVLPILPFLLALIGSVITSFIIAKHLRLPETERNLFLFALFFGLNPHIFILVYYVYLVLPFIFWCGIAVATLFWSELPFKTNRFIGCILIYTLFLGSYPPIIAFLLIIFLSKQLAAWQDKTQTIKQCFTNACYFAAQFLLAFVCYKLICLILASYDYIDYNMYNLKTRSILTTISLLPQEFINSFGQLIKPYAFMGYSYSIPLTIMVIAALILVIYRAENKTFVCIWLTGIFLSSRFVFLVAENASSATFRSEFWSRSGLYLFAISTILRSSNQLFRNITTCFLAIILIMFSKTDFEIQKVWYLGFNAERLYHKRVEEQLLAHPRLNLKHKYLTLSFGQPNFGQRYYDLAHEDMPEGEFLDHLTLPFDFINQLFWDDITNPTGIKTAIWDNNLFKLNVKTARWINTPQHIENIRYWLYTTARQYPHKDSIYVDDRYLLIVLDKLNFHKNKETAALYLDKP